MLETVHPKTYHPLFKLGIGVNWLQVKSMEKQNTFHGKSDLTQLHQVKSDDVGSMIPNTKYVFITIGYKDTCNYWY